MDQLARWIAVVSMVIACGGESKTARPAGPGGGNVSVAAGRAGGAGTSPGDAGGASAHGGVGPDETGGAGETAQSAGTGNRSDGGATGGSKAGRGGKAGTGGEGGVVECFTGEAGGPGEEGGRPPSFVCWNGPDAHQDCNELDCVSDCTSSAVVRGQADGCNVRCPAEAPVPARNCNQRCDDGVNTEFNYYCGPGLFCNRDTFTYVTYSEACAEGSQCGCSLVPASCPEPGPNDWVCAGNGKAYPSSCEAHRARTDVVAYDNQATCAPPLAGLYQCGGIFCHSGLETCHELCCSDDHMAVNYECVPIVGAGGTGGESGAGAGGS